MIEEQLFRRLAVECFQNTENLYKEAVLLNEHGYGARSVALAVIGCEEFAKAVIYTVGALFPESRHPIFVARNTGLRVHEVKHMINQAAEVAQIDTHEGWIIAKQETGYWPELHTKLEDMFIYLGRKGISYVLTSDKKAKKYYKEMEKKYQFGSPSKLKEDALYVDFVGGEIRTPDKVADRAAAEIGELEFYLEEYEALPEVVKDEEAWSRFSKRVREAISKWAIR